MDIFSIIADAEKNAVPCVLCTIVQADGSVPRHVGSKMLVYSDRRIVGSVGGGEVEKRTIDEAIACLTRRKPRIVKYSFNPTGENSVGVCGGTVEIFIEPLLGRPTLLVIGFGHVGKQVAMLGHMLGFRVVMSDDREKPNPGEEYPENVPFLNCLMQEIPDQMALDANTYIVAVTRGNEIDIAGLPSLLHHPWAYLGVIGSKRRWSMTRNALINGGISAELIERIHSPIGVHINAETPAEIAVSIMAEVIQIKNGTDRPT